MVMLIGLASKNAILIVEFANQAHEQGKLSVFTNLQGLTGDKTNGTYGGYNAGV